MYKLLKKMRNYYSYDKWLVLVEQAHNKFKITDEQYNELIAMTDENV